METLIKRHWVFVGIILAVYGLTLQTIPNGSGNPYMIDVGETQIALNIWGTLHATGYPLYTILGNLLTPLPQLVGVNPAAAASLVSTCWTLVGLGLLYGLLKDTTKNALLALLSVLFLALTRSVWLHSVIAEVYSLSFAILMGLWVIALQPASLEKRLWGLALLGGVGIAHHRALGFAGLGLIFALLPDLYQQWRRLPRLVAGAMPLFLLGFLPYLYLPLRAQAEWAYASDVDTWDGFWFNFLGKEADYLIKRPHDLAGWLDNFRGTLEILSRELTPIGLVVALLCLGISLWLAPQKKLARMCALSGLGFFAFAVSYHQAVLPEAIVMMTLPSFAVSLGLTVAWLWEKTPQWGWAGAAGLLLWALALIPFNYSFIHGLTHNRAAFASIEAASSVPRTPLEKPIFMLSWGPRYFAASYSRLITGENGDLRMVDHTADFAQLAQEGYTFYTEPDTLYGYPLSWWDARLGKVYVTSAGWNLVRLGTAPRLVENMDTTTAALMTDGIWLLEVQLTCNGTQLRLGLGWYAQAQPSRDYQVKVHLLAADGRLLAQADSNAPVHGWRPTSTFMAGELIADHYHFDPYEAGATVALGLYEQLPDASFVNYGDYTQSLPAACLAR